MLSVIPPGFFTAIVTSDTLTPFELTVYEGLIESTVPLISSSVDATVKTAVSPFAIPNVSDCMNGTSISIVSLSIILAITAPLITSSPTSRSITCITPDQSDTTFRSSRVSYRSSSDFSALS